MKRQRPFQRCREQGHKAVEHEMRVLEAGLRESLAHQLVVVTGVRAIGIVRLRPDPHAPYQKLIRKPERLHGSGWAVGNIRVSNVSHLMPPEELFWWIPALGSTSQLWNQSKKLQVIEKPVNANANDSHIY